MMASPKIEKSRLRDLILAYYADNDPMRLQDGIDINGMVDWTMDNGIGALNMMLKQSYGSEIDADDRTEINNVEHINRISMAVSGRQVMNMQEMRKVRIAEMLKQFYKKLDPSKLPAIFKLTEYALYKGENALNSKLRMKYGVDLRTFNKDDESSDDSSEESEDPFPPPVSLDSKPVLPEKEEEEVSETPQTDLLLSMKVKSVPTPVVPESPVVVIHKKVSIQDLDILEPEYTAKFEEVDIPDENTIQKPVIELESENPIEDNGEIVNNLEEDKEFLQAELIKFYTVHDPDKIVVLEALVLWALQLGRRGYNEKLMQLYGADLDSPLPTQEAVVKNLEPTPSRMTRINKPIKENKLLKHRENGPEKNSYLSFEQAAQEGVKKADPLKGPKMFKEYMLPDGTACDNYRIDMTSALFGICVCGFPKRAHKF